MFGIKSNKIFGIFGNHNKINQTNIEKQIIINNDIDIESIIELITEKIREFKLNEALELAERKIKGSKTDNFTRKLMLKKCEILLWQGKIEEFKKYFEYILKIESDEKNIYGELYFLYVIENKYTEKIKDIKEHFQFRENYSELEIMIIENYYNRNYKKNVEINNPILTKNTDRILMFSYYFESIEKTNLNYRNFDYAEELYINLNDLCKIERLNIWSLRINVVINSIYLGVSNNESMFLILEKFMEFYKENKMIIENEENEISISLINSYILCLEIKNEKDEVKIYLDHFKKILNTYNYCLYVLINKKDKNLIIEKFKNTGDLKWVELAIILYINFNKEKEAIKLLEEIDIESIKRNEILYLFWIKNKVKKNKRINEKDIEFLKESKNAISEVIYLDYKTNVLQEITDEEIENIILKISKHQSFRDVIEYLVKIGYRRGNKLLDKIDLLGKNHPYIYEVILKKMYEDSTLSGILFNSFSKKIPKDEIKNNRELLGDLYLQFSNPRKAMELFLEQWEENKNIYLAQKIFQLSLVFKEPKEEIYKYIEQNDLFNEDFFKFKQIYHLILVNRKKELIEATKLIFKYYYKKITPEEANNFAPIHNLILKKASIEIEEDIVFYNKEKREYRINPVYKGYMNNSFSVILETKKREYRENLKKGSLISLLVSEIFYKNIKFIKGVFTFNINEEKNPLDVIKKYSGVNEMLELQDKYLEEGERNISLENISLTLNLPDMINSFIENQNKKGTAFTVQGNYIIGERVIISLESILLLYKLDLLKFLKRGYIQQSVFNEIKKYQGYTNTEWINILEQLSDFEENDRIVDDINVVSLIKEKKEINDFEKSLGERGFNYCILNNYVYITEDKKYKYFEGKYFGNLVSNTLSFYFSKQFFYPNDIEMFLKMVSMGFKNFIPKESLKKMFLKENLLYKIHLTKEEKYLCESIIRVLRKKH